MKNYNFYKIIEKKEILIPDIQRDYVQGRDNVGTKVKIKKFIDTLVSAIVNSKKLSLNFVYGYSDNDRFIPIDGQQRLTTLYLLHLFVFAKAGCLNELDNCKKVNYQVRPSSNRFIDALIKNISELIKYPEFIEESPIAKLKIKNKDLKPKSFDDEKNDLSVFLSECVLVQQKWFRRSWLNDLTVKSSIIVLYLIKEAFNNSVVDYKDIVDRLKEDLITFSIRELENPNENANDTYVKMNARGKQLTCFENLKVDLYDFFDCNNNKIETDFINDFKVKVDSDWLKVLLELNKKKITSPKDDIERLNQVDLAIFELLNIVITNNYAKFNPDIVTDDYSIFNKLISKIYLNSDYLNLDIFIKEDKTNQNNNEENNEKSKEQKKSNKVSQIELTQEKLQDLFIKSLKDFSLLMNFLVELGNNLKDKEQHVSIFNDVIVYKDNSDDFVLDNTYGTRRLLIYCAILFLSKVSTITMEEKKKQFYIWMRTIKNIIEHSEIDSKVKFVDALNSFDECKIDFSKVYNSIKKSSSISFLDDSPFNKAQILDERLKAELCNKEESWESIILSYDDNDYFRGQSIFLTETNIDTISQEMYKSYWELTKAIFKDYYKEKDHTFIDVLTPWFVTKRLIQLDDGVKHGYSFGFFDTQHHNYDWRAVFEKKDYVNTYIEMLVEYNNCNSRMNICEYAKSKCEEYINNHRTTIKPNNKDEYLQYVLAHGYNITDWFVQGRYKEKDNTNRYSLAKIKSFARDDCLDLALVYCLFKFGGTDVVNDLYAKKIIIDCTNNCVDFKTRKIKISYLHSNGLYQVDNNGNVEFGLDYNDLINKLSTIFNI